jgi:diguanylate cyclase (GGDEF)-like protein
VDHPTPETATPEPGRELELLRARVDLEDRLRRALETADGEAEVLALLAQALDERFGPSVRVLVPDPARLRLGPANLLDPDTDLVDADGCAGFRRGAPVVTESSRQFDACAHLRDRGEPVSGVCIPVAVGETVAGVVQWVGPERSPLGALEVATIEAVAHLAACHLLLRRAADTERPATDPLTGLLTPRSLGRAILDLVTDLVPFSLAVCTIDELDDYNTGHGHEVGDEALRLFTGCLQATVRPGDVVARTDLDQFTVVFPSTSALDAAQALERVRERLVLALAESSLPAFSVSMGVADSNQGTSIEAITETAELACLLARSAGSNRVVVAGEETPDLLDPPD